MNKLLAGIGGNLNAALQNPHVSISLLGMGVCEIGKIWMPHYANQWESTQKICEGYAMLSASNSAPKPNEKVIPAPATPPTAP